MFCLSNLLLPVSELGDEPFGDKCGALWVYLAPSVYEIGPIALKYLATLLMFFKTIKISFQKWQLKWFVAEELHGLCYNLSYAYFGFSLKITVFFANYWSAFLSSEDCDVKMICVGSRSVRAHRGIFSFICKTCCKGK